MQTALGLVPPQDKPNLEAGISAPDWQVSPLTAALMWWHQPHNFAPAQSCPPAMGKPLGVRRRPRLEGSVMGTQLH